MKANEKLQKDLQNAIKFEPLLQASEIGIVEKDGVVTLTGTVDSYSKIIEAENIVKKVPGVKVIVDKMEVDYKYFNKNDNEIAVEIINILKWNLNILQEKLVIKILGGWIYLDGTLDWNYQRESANMAMSNISGVKGVINNIKIKSELKNQIEKEAIENAFNRNWVLNYDSIYVDVSGCKVTLRGTVDSFYEKEEAERIAWNTLGVCAVNNELTIRYLA
jgi:osmotically-inducible protein OsmY